MLIEEQVQKLYSSNESYKLNIDQKTLSTLGWKDRQRTNYDTEHGYYSGVWYKVIQDVEVNLIYSDPHPLLRISRLYTNPSGIIDMHLYYRGFLINEEQIQLIEDIISKAIEREECLLHVPLIVGDIITNSLRDGFDWVVIGFEGKFPITKRRYYKDKGAYEEKVWKNGYYRINMNIGEYDTML